MSGTHSRHATSVTVDSKRFTTSTLQEQQSVSSSTTIRTIQTTIDGVDGILGPQEFSDLFGGKVEQIKSWCAPYLDTIDWRYRVLTHSEREKMFLETLRQLESVSVAGAHRKPTWESGWSENLKELVDSGYNLDALVPKYVKRNQVVRLFGNYIQPSNPDFIRDHTKILRAWLAQRYLADAAAIYEFGCGPCSHVSYFAETFPEKKIVGLDWATASQRIIEALATHFGWNIAGYPFDFFAPNRTVRLPEGTVVLTVAALEQIGDRHEAFVDYLLENRPMRCVHFECVEELYDPDDMFDYVVLRYHRQRNYLSGFLTRLRELEQEGRIVIESVHRQQFGGTYNDAYSCIVWKPI